jgi:hypothetical protein
MSGRNPYTLAFYVAFALWFTATRYSPPSFYGPMLTSLLGLATMATLVAVAVQVGLRAMQAVSFP